MKYFSHLLFVAITLAGGCFSQNAESKAKQNSEDTPLSENDLKFRNPKTFPKWSQFPVAPKNVPTASDIKSNVVGTEIYRSQLEYETSQLIWEMQTPEEFTALVLQGLDVKKSAPIDSKLNLDAIESYAQTLRDRVNPPKPID